MIDVDLAKRFIDYNRKSGLLKWKYTTPDMFTASKRTAEQKCRMFNARYADNEAFTSTNGHGYKCGVILGIRITAHRLIWMLEHGHEPDQIDHINGNRTDNRISNLRNVSKKENGRNLSISKRNKSGVTGVRFNQRRSKWEADIRVDRKLVFIGRFDKLEDAISARKAAEAKYGFHKNHGSR